MDEPMRATAYEFGDFRVDVVKRSLLLRADGRPLPVSARAFDTLLFFLEHPGELLDKSTLMAAIWPKVVVEENNLNQHISALRRLLGERPEEHRFIVTVPGRGYRFVAAVHELMQDTSAPAQAAAPAPPAASASRAPIAANANEHEPAARVEATSSTATATAPARRPRLAALALITAFAVAALLTGVYALWHARSGTSITSVRVEAPSQSELPAKHSIAVLPFVNLSGDKEQEYFSDGLTEELLNSLAHIDGLQVAARTSSFSFREHPNVADVAHKLNVATVLEGSVRRSGHTIRISAQLINAVTGFHVWSKTYDRDLGDVLKLQTEIATAVANALEVTLLGDAGAKIGLGGTQNPAAFDSYLRAFRAAESEHSAKDVETAISAFSEAIRLDPNYALAFAGRSGALHYHAWAYARGAAIREDNDRAHADARQAITLAPGLAEGHLALALALQYRTLDFAQVSVEFERALALAPGNARVLGYYGYFAVSMGRTDSGIAAARRAVVLDPLNPESHIELGIALTLARRYAESVAAWNDALVLDPQDPYSPALRGIDYYLLGDFERARASCEAAPDNDVRASCLALTYHKLDRHADAKIALAKLRAAGRWPYTCATIYAQWGNTSQALESLESAWRLRDPELRFLKADPLMDPLRKEPRFQAIERALKFPN
jgi:TolB-like protein/DNA-binding winged helix-turn-helix (wHTH) protein/Tfp pilus assembly protein PilF